MLIFLVFNGVRFLMLKAPLEKRNDKFMHFKFHGKKCLYYLDYNAFSCMLERKEKDKDYFFYHFQSRLDKKIRMVKAPMSL